MVQYNEFLEIGVKEKDEVDGGGKRKIMMMRVEGVIVVIRGGGSWI